MNQNTCNVCNKSFNSEPEMREHQRNAHAAAGTVKQGQDRSSGEPKLPNRAEQNQPNRSEQSQDDREKQDREKQDRDRQDRERKIAS